MEMFCGFEAEALGTHPSDRGAKLPGFSDVSEQARTFLSEAAQGTVSKHPKQPTQLPLTGGEWGGTVTNFQPSPSFQNGAPRDDRMCRLHLADMESQKC